MIWLDWEMFWFAIAILATLNGSRLPPLGTVSQSERYPAYRFAAENGTDSL